MTPQIAYRVGGNICTDARLVEGVHIWVRPVEHAVELENVAVSISAAEFVSSALFSG